MKSCKNKLKNLLQSVLFFFSSFLPRRLPVGVTEFHNWANRIIKKAGQFADEESMKFVLATELIRLERRAKYISDRFFVNALHAAAAKQIGGAMFQEIKAKQQTQQAQLKMVEATTQGSGNSNESKT